VVLGSLLLVVLGASLVPARRATRVDPASTIRSD
jgi:ABC-type lipoprotein release transport system permease subunit